MESAVVVRRSSLVHRYRRTRGTATGLQPDTVVLKPWQMTCRLRLTRRAQTGLPTAYACPCSARWWSNSTDGHCTSPVGSADACWRCSPPARAWRGGRGAGRRDVGRRSPSQRGQDGAVPRRASSPVARRRRRPIETSPGGYRLNIEPADTDVARFERLATDGANELRLGHFAAATKLLVAAPRTVAWSRPHRVRGCELRDRRPVPARGAAAVRAGGSRRSTARHGRSADCGPGDGTRGRRAPGPRTGVGAADARPVRVGPPARRLGRVPARTCRAR